MVPAVVIAGSCRAWAADPGAAAQAASTDREIVAGLDVTPLGGIANGIPPVQPAPGGAAAADGTSGAIYGIGANLGADGDYTVVNYIVNGGAAASEGHLKAGDHIAAIAEGDGPFVDCKGADIRKVVYMTRGESASSFRLSVIPAADPSKREEITLVRKATSFSVLDFADQSKLASLFKKVMDAERENVAEDIGNEAQKVIQTTGLDASGSNTLEKAASVAVDQRVRNSASQLFDLLEVELQGIPAKQRDSLFDQAGSQAAAAAKNLAFEVKLPAEKSPWWTAALKQILTPTQSAAWDDALAKERQAAEAGIATYLDRAAAYGREFQQNLLDPLSSEIRMELNLPKDRDDKLRELEKDLVAKAGEAARASAREKLLAMSETQRKECVSKRSPINLFPAPTTAGWDQGLAKLLTADEMNRLQAMRQARIDMRAAATGRLLVALLDERIALTGDQRRKLEPIAQRLVKTDGELIASRNPNEYFSYSPGNFFMVVAANAHEDEIKPILDPVQWAHWIEVCAMTDADENSNGRAPIALPPADGAAKSAAVAAEPEEIEREISSYLSGKSEVEREKIVRERVLKAEDIARTVHLAPAMAERLETAARGEADAMMPAWNDAAEEMVRSNVTDTSPDMVRQCLDSIQPFQFMNISMQTNGSRAGAERLWNKTVRSTLSRDQRMAWQAATDARSAYREDAIAGYIVSQVDQEIGLAPEEWKKLEPMVAAVLKEYGSDIESTSGDSSEEWFLQSNYVFLPMAGLSDGDLKSVLSDTQFSAWKRSGSGADAASLFKNVTQFHDQRTREEVRF